MQFIINWVAEPPGTIVGGEHVGKTFPLPVQKSFTHIFNLFSKLGTDSTEASQEISQRCFRRRKTYRRLSQGSGDSPAGGGKTDSNQNPVTPIQPHVCTDWRQNTFAISSTSRGTRKLQAAQSQANLSCDSVSVFVTAVRGRLHWSWFNGQFLGGPTGAT